MAANVFSDRGKHLRLDQVNGFLFKTNKVKVGCTPCTAEGARSRLCVAPQRIYGLHMAPSRHEPRRPCRPRCGTSHKGPRPRTRASTHPHIHTWNHVRITSGSRNKLLTSARSADQTGPYCIRQYFAFFTLINGEGKTSQAFGRNIPDYGQISQKDHGNGQQEFCVTISVLF